ncbi:ABC transporter ATP-binding protein [Paenibacillus allorhizosphaerae]|uniref:Multidrug export ATP-binding/permease protein n=1 Tax=Paenibacillus allorhizosphaerae TaxID=2849866 RepID=A0ABN7U1Y9_9BACL|nr:ABC transporter ATP-binding protein [Paenibacillus allorhizosphaerae]CAG7659160.1 Putative multidrug export ATP-binding/permease protein [Paenibacillus allorhizosphaerae]
MQSLKVYIWVLSYLRKYIVPFTLILMTGIIISGSMLAIPKFIQYLIDRIIPNRDTRLLLTLIIILIFLIAIRIAATAARNLLQRYVQENTSRDLQLSLFQHLRKLGFTYYEKNAVGEILSMFHTEVPAVQNIYRRYLPYLIEKIVTLCISTVLLFSIDVKLALIIIPCFVSYYMFGPYFEKKQTQYARAGTKRRTEYNKKIYDSLSGLLELRIQKAESWDITQLMEKFNANRSMWLKELLFALLRGTSRRVTVNIGALIMFVFGAYAIRSGDLLVGEFVAFIFYYFQVMWDLSYVVTALTEQRMLLIQAEKLHQFIHRIPDLREPESPILLHEVEGKITFRNVCFGYQLGADTIQGFTLDIQKGERVAIVGSSGGGKSTLIKLIGRFYDPYAGEIYLDNVPIKQLSFKQLRDSIGYVFQETYLFGSNIKENIRFGNPDAGDDEIIEAAKAAYAHEFITQLPQGYETLVGERGTKLSGGQKQRIAIARMLLKKPSIILLDEATSSLDNVSEKEVQYALQQLLEGRTTIAVAHRLSTVRHYDRIIVMEQGRIVEMGTYDELFKRKGKFYRLLEGEDATSA